MATVDWKAIARRTMHPIQVQILERLEVRDEPLSPSVLLPQTRAKSITHLAYHFRALADSGVIVFVELKTGGKRRGAGEHFYELAPEVRK